MRYPRLIAALAVTGSMFVSAQLQADTYLSIGSNPVGNTAYQWAAGISEVVNKNVEGVNAAAEGTKGYVANVQLMLDGKVEAGFSNTKLAYEAHHAEGDYAGQKWPDCGLDVDQADHYACYCHGRFRYQIGDRSEGKTRRHGSARRHIDA